MKTILHFWRLLCFKRSHDCTLVVSVASVGEGWSFCFITVLSVSIISGSVCRNAVVENILDSRFRWGVSGLHVSEGDEEPGHPVQISSPQTLRLSLPLPGASGGKRRCLHVSLLLCVYIDAFPQKSFWYSTLWTLCNPWRLHFTLQKVLLLFEVTAGTLWPALYITAWLLQLFLLFCWHSSPSSRCSLVSTRKGTSFTWEKASGSKTEDSQIPHHSSEDKMALASPLHLADALVQSDSQ